MKVSIILPVYNKINCLERCVKSIISQRFKDFELIIVDDGSTDGSSTIIDNFASLDNRIRVVHKVNDGVSSARNIALDLAKGKYIQFVDSDDYITKDSTEILVNSIEKYNTDMVITHYYRVVKKYFSKKGDIKTRSVLNKLDFAEFMLKDPANYYYGVLWNKLFKTSIIRKYNLKMDEDLKWCEDFVFNMQYILHIKNIVAIPKPIYYYIKTDNSLVANSLNVPDIINMKFTIFEYYSNFYKELYDEKSYMLKIPNIYKFFIDFAKDHFVMPINKNDSF